MIAERLLKIAKWFFIIRMVNVSLKIGLFVMRNWRTYSEVYYFLSSLYIGLKKPEQSVAIIEEGLGYLSESVEYFLHIAHLYEQMGDPQKALDYLIKAERIDPTNNLVFLSMARFYFFFNQADQASVYFQRIQDWYSNALGDNIQYFFLKGMLAVRDENYQEALDIFEWLNEIVISPEFLIQQAYCYYKLKEYDDAEAIIKKLSQYRPGDVILDYQLALVYEARGEIDKAHAIMERLLNEQSEQLKRLKYDPEMANLLKDPKLRYLYERLTTEQAEKETGDGMHEQNGEDGKVSNGEDPKKFS